MALRSGTQLVSSAFNRYKSNASLFLSIAALPVVILVCVGALSLVMVNAGGYIAGGALAFIGLIAVVVASVFSTIALVLATSDSTTYSTWQNAYNAATKHFWSYLIVSALMTLAVIGGLILLIIPGIIFAVWFSLCYFTLLLDGKSGTDALKASKALVKGRFGSVFLRLLLLVIIYMVCSAIIGVIVSVVPIPKAIAEVVSNALGILITPFGIAYLYELYRDLKSEGGAASAVEAPVSHSDSLAPTAESLAPEAASAEKKPNEW